MLEREIKLTSEERDVLLFVADKLIEQFKEDLKNDDVHKGHLFSATPKYTKEWLTQLESVYKKLDF